MRHKWSARGKTMIKWIDPDLFLLSFVSLIDCKDIAIQLLVHVYFTMTSRNILAISKLGQLLDKWHLFLFINDMIQMSI